jgi:predicted metal-binding protein
MNERPAPPHVLAICRTCPRYERAPPDEKTRGAALLDAVKAASRGWPLSDAFLILGVQCLSGCPSPCNIALEAEDKPRVRFRHLGPEHAATVLELATLYYRSVQDRFLDSLPAEQRGKIGSITPPPAAIE